MKTNQKNIISRRSWLSKSSLGAGALAIGAQAIPTVSSAYRPFGLTPLNTPLLNEPYPIIEKDLPPMRARLLANENPYGPSPKAIEAIKNSAIKGNRYVYQSSAKFAQTLADKEGVTYDQILISPGSTDILEKFAFATCLKGGNVISADPGYMSIVKTAQAIGATWKNIPLRLDFSHDLDAMEAAVDTETRFVYICNPNNPTASITAPQELEAFAKRVSKKVPVFIDEAYIELMDNGKSMVGLVQEGYDVIICRTYSKIHGMAGLRIGYMVGSADRVEKIKGLVRTEMGISVTSLEAAIASTTDEQFLAKAKKLNKEAREYVTSSLLDIGYDPVPSHTSFILFPIAMPTKDFQAKMLGMGIGIRVFTIADQPHCRVSMGTMDEVAMFMDSLKKITG